MLGHGRGTTWGLLAATMLFLASLSPAHDLTPEVAARLVLPDDAEAEHEGAEHEGAEDDAR